MVAPNVTRCNMRVPGSWYVVLIRCGTEETWMKFMEASSAREPAMQLRGADLHNAL